MRNLRLKATSFVKGKVGETYNPPYVPKLRVDKCFSFN